MENVAVKKARKRISAFDEYTILIQQYQQIGLTNINIHKLVKNEMMKKSKYKKIPGFRAFMFWVERTKKI